MIENKLVPNINMFERIEPSKYSTGIRFDGIEKPETQDFKAVFTGLVENLNNDIARPDQLLKDNLSGNSNVDIHDVMLAINQSQIAVQTATNITTKVIQAYDKIMAIQI